MRKKNAQAKKQSKVHLFSVYYSNNGWSRRNRREERGVAEAARTPQRRKRSPSVGSLHIASGWILIYIYYSLEFSSLDLTTRGPVCCSSVCLSLLVASREYEFNTSLGFRPQAYNAVHARSETDRIFNGTIYYILFFKYI